MDDGPGASCAAKPVGGVLAREGPPCDTVTVDGTAESDFTFVTAWSMVSGNMILRPSAARIRCRATGQRHPLQMRPVLGDEEVDPGSHHSAVIEHIPDDSPVDPVVDTVGMLPASILPAASRQVPQTDLVAPGDAGGITDALLRLAQQPGERARLAAAGRAEAADRFDLARMVARTEDLYRALRARRPAPDTVDGADTTWALAGKAER